MQHIYDLDTIHLEGCWLTIGSFDGVHLGHQTLVQNLVEDAHAAGFPSVALTFYPHPSAVLKSRRPTFYLTSPDEKATLLGEMGVDYVITQRFDWALSEVSAETFLDRLQAQLGFRHLWVGQDFAFGHQRQGDVTFLKAVSQRREFQLHLLSPIRIDNEIVSSTRIRQALREGDIQHATKLLGRHYVLPGKVVVGSSRGKNLGFPTANLLVEQERAIPSPGVYASTVEVLGQTFLAVSNIGVRPTFDDQQAIPSIETHLLDFNGDLYQHDIRLAFVARLRDERRFPNPDALITQIEKDILQARDILQSILEATDAKSISATDLSASTGAS
jgi:riboflavin kinase/FMN adenylyltransferase